MNNGSVIEEGTHDKLLELNGTYSKYWESGT
jgi:ABC-type multidrug transport system fused ATPase/permease subunit